MLNEQIKEEYIYEISEDERMLVAMLRLMEDGEREAFLKKSQEILSTG